MTITKKMTEDHKTIQDIIKQRVLILDGAMGTMIQLYGLEEKDFRGTVFANADKLLKGDNDLLCLTRPDVILDIHRKYLAAGADIIETNTFNAQSVSQSDYGTQGYCREINLAACRLARQAADEYSRQTPDKPRFVAGSIGPTNKTCSMSPDVDNPALRDLTFDPLCQAYEEQIDALVEGGVDVLLIETIFDTLNAKAAVVAAERVFDRHGKTVPVMLSVTIGDKSGRTLSGQTLKAFLTSMDFAPVLSVGVNCSFGPLEIKPYLVEIASDAPHYISVYPNAGLPNEMGEYDITPQQMAGQMKSFVDEGLVNVIGGCCGTTDDYIALYQDIIRDDRGWKKPHQPVLSRQLLELSGLDRLQVRPESNFINIGERCNVAGSRKFLRLIKEHRYDEAQQIARKQVEDGAQILDINMDDGLLNARKEMVSFLNLITADPDICHVPLMVDSSNWDVILAALKCVQGKCVVNSISLKEGEDVFVSHARDLKRLGAAVVVMAFDETGQATSYEHKIRVCERAYRILTEKVHFKPSDIIFDPNILTIGTGMAEHNDYAINFLKATHWIRTHLPSAHVSGGVSNLSFAFRGNNYLRQAMHAIFLYHAIREGMDMGIVNPSASLQYDDIPPHDRELIEDLIFNRRPDATERVVEVSGGQEVPPASMEQAEPVSQCVEQRLAYALRKGISDHLEEDLKEALDKYPHAVDIIEGPLMQGMGEVGELFGAGKMFLPQVVKTARTMKRAVEILQPYIEQEKSTSASTGGKVLMATVKGDVHDIGKNIVSVVLSCNNYMIIDLGVMVPAEQIVAEALRLHPDMIGLSGLITPSLDEMIHTLQALRKAGIRIPVMVGGATTSELHTALKMAPEYDGPVVWAKDAAQASLIAGKITSPDTAPAYVADLYATYDQLRQGHHQEQHLASLEASRHNKLNLFEESN